MNFVRQTPNGLVFPPSIPSRRGKPKTILLVIFYLICVTGGWYKSNCGCLYLAVFVCSLILLVALVEVILRIHTLIVEYPYLTSHYNTSIKTLLVDVFSFSPVSLFVAIISLVVFFLTYILNKEPPPNCFCYASTCWFSAAVCFSTKLLPFAQSPINTSYQIENSNGLDYGSGMAHSFFHGYLRIILPHTGLENDKGLREFQQDYEARNHINFAVYKLFILIPFSQHCPPRLDSDYSPSVSVSKGLESKEIDRAGVSKRNYKNSVYKIRSKTQKLYYVSAEYATPVKTLFEVVKQNTYCANLYKKYGKELLYNFYTTLLGLLNEDHDCRDLCEIIYYNDIDNNGKYYDVGGIILKRLRQIKKNL